MSRLLACPFCRSLFGDDETDGVCPECGIELKPMEKLPPSLEAMAEDAAAGEVTPPEERTLPWTYLGRGRGALLLLSVLGILAFFAPWVEMTMPDLASISAYELARGRAGWLWGGAVAWFVMIPLVATRRSVARMRGVRIITTLFSAMTLGEVAMLVSLPPAGGGTVPIAYSWGLGLYASAIISAIGVFFAVRFGGRLDNLPALTWEDERGRGRVETSDGETLH